jgi:hypothetical protein
MTLSEFILELRELQRIAPLADPEIHIEIEGEKMYDPCIFLTPLNQEVYISNLTFEEHGFYQ